VNVEEHDFTGRGTGDEVGHGTAVAGLVSQLAPDADVVSLRIFGDSGRTGVKPIADAYEWLVDHADEVDVANFSWGARSNDEGLNALHRRLLAAGVQDVVSAGNTGAEGGSPATAEGAFSVGALTKDGAVTRFSSYNPNRDNPDVAAIGKNIKLARATGTSMGHVIDEHWVKASGTSFSAPITAGLASRYLSVADGDVMTRFEASARNIPETPEDGEGIVDIGRALAGDEGKPTTDVRVWGLFGLDVVLLDSDWFDSGRYEAVRVDDRTVKLVGGGRRNN
jgi:subtilisin family serine protease